MCGQGLSANLESNPIRPQWWYFLCFLTAHMRVSSIQYGVSYISRRAYIHVYTLLCIYRHNYIEGCIPSKGGLEFYLLFIILFYFLFLTACIPRYLQSTEAQAHRSNLKCEAFCLFFVCLPLVRSPVQSRCECRLDWLSLRYVPRTPEYSLPWGSIQFSFPQKHESQVVLILTRIGRWMRVF